MAERRHVGRRGIHFTIPLVQSILLLLTACEGNPVAVELESPDPGDVCVLFIGNDVTGYFGMPAQFEALADSQGKGIWVGNATADVETLEQYLEYASLDGRIAEQDWDWVVLQDLRYAFAFPDSYELLYPTYETLRERIRNENPEARIVIFMPYALESTTLRGSTYTFDTLQPMIREGTIAIADSLGFVIAPVGWAFRRIRSERPDIPLYDTDGYLPSREAQYLQACVYYTTIFGSSPEGSPFSAGLPDSTTACLQQVAAEVVLGEAETWNLPPGR